MTPVEDIMAKEKCGECNGKGTTSCPMEYGGSHPPGCPACGGEQKVVCPECNGTGEVG